MIDKLSSIREQFLSVIDTLGEDEKASLTPDNAYLGVLVNIGKLSEAIILDKVNKTHFEETLVSLMFLDYLTDKSMSIEAIDYQISKSESYEPKFNMICFIVDKINDIGKHYSSGLHSIVYAYLTQCANFYGFKLKDCIR